MLMCVISGSEFRLFKLCFVALILQQIHWFLFKNDLYLSYVLGAHAYHSECVKIKGQLLGVIFYVLIWLGPRTKLRLSGLLASIFKSSCWPRIHCFLIQNN